LDQRFVKFGDFSLVGFPAFAELFLKRKLSFPVSRMRHLDQAVEQRGRHLGVTEHSCPLAEAEIGRDGDLVRPRT
jgi:hypothetical protein